MPYIEQDQRKLIDGFINILGAGLKSTGSDPGELNYVITRLMLEQVGDKPSYEEINKLIGVLECVKLEFYRRYAAPYEDDKAKQNGDVYR